MRFDLSPDQQLFRETTARFLADTVPPAELRARRDDLAGFDPDEWRQGAELGWTSLLVSEASGGGSLSGDGLADLALVAHEFGAAAAPGPLLVTNVVAFALDRAGGHREVLDAFLSGESVATWCGADLRPGPDGPTPSVEAELVGGDVVVRGTTRPVESAAQSTHVLVAARTGDGLTQVLVPADAPGVGITPLQSVDLTRRFAAVTFDEVRLPAAAVVGAPGEAADAVRQQLDVALALTCAEAVGAMQSAFEMTRTWLDERYSFGRPLASYQALKHRVADMAMWLEASHAITDAAVGAVAAGAPTAADLVSAAKAYVGDRGGELVQECVQLHGGIGVTFEHDVHLYLRRHTLARTLYGRPAEHRRRLADLAREEEVA